MIKVHGLQGAAIAWTVRTAFNCFVLHVMTWRSLPGSSRAIKKNAALLVMAVLVLAASGLLKGAVGFKAGFLASAFAAVVVVAWFRVMSHEERAELMPALYLKAGQGN
jgi:hypothetical protein